MYINFSTCNLKTPASQRHLEGAILYNYFGVVAFHCCWSILLPWQAQGSCDAPACVYLYSDTGWPHASTPHFSHCQILHIFDLQYSIIGHQLNYYRGVIILNLSLQNCRNEEEWLIIPTFACGSTTMSFFLQLIESKPKFLFFIYSQLLSLSVQASEETAEEYNSFTGVYTWWYLGTSVLGYSASVLFVRRALQYAALILRQWS